MILPNSKSTKVCVNESDYLALIDAATDILDALKAASENGDILPDWSIKVAIDNLEDALKALGEL